MTYIASIARGSHYMTCSTIKFFCLFLLKIEKEDFERNTAFIFNYQYDNTLWIMPLVIIFTLLIGSPLLIKTMNLVHMAWVLGPISSNLINSMQSYRIPTGVSRILQNDHRAFTL